MRWTIPILALAVCSGEREWYQTQSFNSFASAYNQFVEGRGRGINDLRALKRMRAAWRHLEQSDGWPDQKPCRE